MKLENRHMAQARRAKERQKQARINKIRKYIWIPLVAVVIIVIAVAAVKIEKANSQTETEAESSVISTETENETGDVSTEAAETAAEEEAASDLNTDISLTVEDGDTVNIDYIGYVDGVEFEGGNTNGAGADLEIGSGTYIDGFEDQIIGHNVGETFDITVTFPDGYGDTTTVDGETVTLDNQEVVFTVTVNGIYE